ncbi:MAG: J domain-containing protein [Desulfobacterales bacterium]
MKLQRCLKILELETIGSLQEAKRAYKDLVRVWHPDRFQSNPRLKQKADKKLREINLAYKYLLNHIESNQTGGLSIPQVASSKSTPGIDVADYAKQSGGYRVERKNPDTARFADPAAKARPRTSSIGRFVLLAFLSVFVAISALVIYFLYSTDKIASMSKGMASEALEKIVDKLEKTKTIPKNDPSVKGIIKELDRTTMSSEADTKFEIHLDSGSIIMTEVWWEESDMIMYRVDGGSMGIERSRVKKIVKR